MRRALGRYSQIMEAANEERIKVQMMQLKESMDEEILKAGIGIWNGVLYGMVMGTWIWGFVLFDTMASVGGVEKGLYVFMFMIACPFLLFVPLRWGSQRIVAGMSMFVPWNDNTDERTSMSINNPLQTTNNTRGSIVEMIKVETDTE
jgi:hypothetical protein